MLKSFRPSLFLVGKRVTAFLVIAVMLMAALPVQDVYAIGGTEVTIAPTDIKVLNKSADGMTKALVEFDLTTASGFAGADLGKIKPAGFLADTYEGTTAGSTWTLENRPDGTGMPAKLTAWAKAEFADASVCCVGSSSVLSTCPGKSVTITGITLGGTENDKYTLAQTTATAVAHITEREKRTDNNQYGYDPVNVRQDFMMGVDLSSEPAMRASTASPHSTNNFIFRNKEGEAEDIYKIYADHGVNYVRARVWNDPFYRGETIQSPSGSLSEADQYQASHPRYGDGYGPGTYGGGNNDINRAVEIGLRATQNNMKLLVDFHYSDFWGDPGRQYAPKAWRSMNITQKRQALYGYTYESLEKLVLNGVDVGMVSVGNETQGRMSGETSAANYCALVKSGCDAIDKINEEYGVNIKKAVHYTNQGQQASSIRGWINTIQGLGAGLDMVMLSWYPEYQPSHGTIDSLLTTMNSIIADHPDLEVSVGETDNRMQGSTFTNQATLFPDYTPNEQGQAKELYDVIAQVARVNNNKGVGVFYWEPAWTTPIDATSRRYYGTGWAARYAAYYDANQSSASSDGNVGSAQSSKNTFTTSGGTRTPLASMDVWSLVYGESGLAPAGVQQTPVEATIDLIAKIGTVELSAESKATIDAARVAYDALTTELKALVTNASDLLAAEVDYDLLVANKNKADVVSSKIVAIGEVHFPESEAKIDEARATYNGLTNTQRDLVTNYEVLSAAEASYIKLKGDQEAANAVMVLIGDIGAVELTPEGLAKIEAATRAYDALSVAQKALVTNLETLTGAKTVYDALAEDKDAVDLVIGKINEIGTVTLESQDVIAAAMAVYDALEDDLQAEVTNVAVLNEAEASYTVLSEAKAAADQVEATAVIDKITAIGEVASTPASKTKVEAARIAYDALSDVQKALVTNLDVLLVAEVTYVAKEKEKDFNDQVSAGVIKILIDEIRTVSLSADSKQKIDHAKAAYERLSAEQKALVTNMNVLQVAEAQYQKLVKDQAAKDQAAKEQELKDQALKDQLANDQKVANAVMVKINGIGKVEATAASKKKIDDAQVAYNALMGSQKKLVTNLKVLEDAKATYEQLTAPPKKGVTFVAGKFKYKVVKAATAKAQGTVQLVGTTNKNITSISIKATVKSGAYTYKIVSISKNAFKNLKKLKTVTIGNNVTTIGNDAFSGCGKITKVTIGKNVKTIGSKAFYNNKKLKNVVIKSTKLKTVGKNAFKGIHNKAKIKVPKSKLKGYTKILKGKGQQGSVKITKG